jgi:hypothetical protein
LSCKRFNQQPLIILVCRRPDLNWYGSHLPQDFKSCASADSATPASVIKMEAPPRLELGVELLQSSALPLGYGANNALWSGRRESNPRPSPWQGDALPLSHFRISSNTGDLGFEPRDDGVKVRCLTAWLIPITKKIMGRSMGLEPTNAGATDQCVNPFATTATVVRLAGAAGIEPTPKVLETFVLPLNYAPIKMVEDDGFEPPNSERADLQSAVFSHFTNPPYSIVSTS